ncbi:hypothetical protein BGZ99_008790 [Dissophora globulifera]|uniref:Uncharacterized protein n=1 Tax=Dissophora globulifera TaxID=979702 RepID=A0A9P6V0V2_9FUNG|nr:hypothetical protein BGZ99_008790 [Dissophora globulifera]
MTRSWQPHGYDLEFEREWQWPDMDPLKTITTSEDSTGEGSSGEIVNMISGESSVSPTLTRTEMAGERKLGDSPTGSVGIKTWDLDDPTLSLGTFLGSPQWRNQTLVPDSDFVNLLRVLRPVDHAFFITLFVNQSPQQLATAQEDGKGTSPKVSSTPSSYNHHHHSCGSWIPDYVEFQNRILDKTLPSRYTIHTCPSSFMPSLQPELGQEMGPKRAIQPPCGDIFSQILAMTSTFAWSVVESRGFFVNPAQLEELKKSFDQSLFQYWMLPPKADSTARVDTSDMTSRDLDRLFQLHDPLFSYYVDNDSGDSNNENDKSQQSEIDNEDSEEKEEEEQLAVEQMQRRLWDLRSSSRNRVSFERKLTPNDAAILPSFNDNILQHQRRLGQRTSAQRMKKLTRGLEQDGVELVLNHDLLPQFVNTTRTLRLFLELGLPLPDRILLENQRRLSLLQSSIARADETSKGGAPTIHAPSAHGSPFGSSSRVLPSFSLTTSSSSSSQERTFSSFYTAIHDERDLSKIQAVPKTFGCLLDILLQPKIELQELIHPYATLFKLPAVFTVGIYIRPTLKSSTASNAAATAGGREPWRLISRNRKATVHRYLTCARQIAREFAPKRKGQKVVYVVVAEDAAMAGVMESQEEWDEEVITPKWVVPKERRQQQRQEQLQEQEQEHGHQQRLPPLSKQQQAVLENWVLSKTDFQVVSDQSDFAKVAVWRTRREGRSVVIRENSAIERQLEKEKTYVDMLDCGALLKNLIVTED